MKLLIPAFAFLLCPPNAWAAEKATDLNKPTVEKSEATEEQKQPSSKKTELAPAGTPSDEDKKPTIWEKVKDGAENAIEDTANGIKRAQENLATTRANRESTKWTITGNYQVFEMWVLNKYGFTLGWNRSPSSTYEFEYMRGSVSAGKFGISIADITEQRMSLLYRSFGKRQSFNLMSGLFYNELSAGYGSDFLSSVPGGYVEALNIKTLGLSFGLGNRWQSKGGFVWSFDWFQFHLPLVILEKKNPLIDASTDANDRDDADDAMNFFAHMPELGVLKIQLGLSW